MLSKESICSPRRLCVRALRRRLQMLPRLGWFMLLQQRYSQTQFCLRMVGLEFQHPHILGRCLACMAGRRKHVRQVLVDLKISGAQPRSLG